MKKNKIKELDQFYTNPRTSDYIVNKISKMNLINKYSHFLEPSAGSGNFIDSLNNILNKKYKILAYDIDPKGDADIKKLDYLKTNVKFCNDRIVIGNPPFGHRGKLALKFLNKSLTESNIVIMILPKTFNRYSIQKHIDKDAKLIHSEELPRDSFLINDRAYNVNCVFQIWVKTKTRKMNLRLLRALPIKHDDLVTFIHNNTKQTLKYFNKKKYKWKYAIHRQGYYDYSKILTSEKELVRNRQYIFINCKNSLANKIIKKIDFTKLAKSNTSIPGFSTTDLIGEYTKLKKEFQNAR